MLEELWSATPYAREVTEVETGTLYAACAYCNFPETNPLKSNESFRTNRLSIQDYVMLQI